MPSLCHCIQIWCALSDKSPGQVMWLNWLHRAIVVRCNSCGLLESVPDFIGVIIDIILALFLHDSVCSNETASSRLQMIQ